MSEDRHTAIEARAVHNKSSALPFYFVFYIDVLNQKQNNFPSLICLTTGMMFISGEISQPFALFRVWDKGTNFT